MNAALLETIYTHIPWWGQNVMASVRGYLDKRDRLGGGFQKKLAELTQSQWWSADEIEAYQNRELQRIFTYAFTEIPFYRAYYRTCGVTPNDIKTRADLKQLPILTKETLIAGLADFPEQFSPPRKISWGATSGSSGKALRFCVEKEAIRFRWALFWRHRQRFSINCSDRFATFTGKPVVPFSQKTPPFWRESYMTNQTIFGMQYIKGDTIEAIVDKLNSDHYVYYSGYPSILSALAELILEKKLTLHVRPKMIFTGAEKLYDYQKKLLGKVFSCDISEVYGFAEGSANASCCEYGNFHEDFEYGILETEPMLEDTLMGAVLGTGFASKIFPLIRYKVGDFCATENIKCQCGRHSRVFKSFEGRVEDRIITPEGVKMARLDYIFKNTCGIKEAQVVQYRLGEICIRYIPREQNIDKNLLIDNIRHYVSPTIGIRFEEVSALPRTNTGKFRAVVSFLDKKLSVS